MIRKGQWLRSYSHIGKALNDEEDGLVNVVLYDRSGEKIGRESPAYDGPKNFEPCCDARNWTPIEEPNFPLNKYCHLDEVTKDKTQ